MEKDSTDYFVDISIRVADKVFNQDILIEKQNNNRSDCTSWQQMLVTTDVLRKMEHATKKISTKSTGSLVYRWILAEKLLEWLNNQDSIFCNPLPRITPKKEPNRELINYLVSIGVTKDSAQSLEAEFINIITSTINSTTPVHVFSAEDIKIVSYDGNVVVQCKSTTNSTWTSKITIYRYKKLKDMHQRSNLTPDDDTFKMNLVRLLMRYNQITSISPGYSGGCPSRLFEYFSELGVTHELFASPLNFTLNYYCSAYDDTDVPFGSQGNFLIRVREILNKGGRFQANPPFTEEYLSVTTEIFLRALNLSVPITIFYVHPKWSDMSGYINLQKSKFLTKQISFLKNNHYYESGLQHDPKHSGRILSAAGSELFILQNDLGRKDLSISAVILDNIKMYFSTAGDTKLGF